MNLSVSTRILVRTSQLSKNISRNKTKSSAEYCLDSVKHNDYENFMCTLLLKSTARSNALAIRSFNIEVAKVGEQVSQNDIGLMRMKFWEEMVDNCFTKDIKKVPQHPVAIEVFKAVMSSPLTKRYFKTLIKSRSDFLNRTSFTSLEEIEKYTEHTVSNVYYLILEGCGIKSIHADHAASHLGKAQGIVQLLRGVPVARKINLMTLPQDILAKNQVSEEEVLRAKKSERLTECTFEVASRAHQHLTKARSLLPQVPAEARRVLLPSVPVENYLDRLQKVHYDAYHPSLQLRSWILFPKLWFTHFNNKY